MSSYQWSSGPIGHSNREVMIYLSDKIVCIFFFYIFLMFYESIIFYSLILIHKYETPYQFLKSL